MPTVPPSLRSTEDSRIKDLKAERCHVLFSSSLNLTINVMEVSHRKAPPFQTPGLVRPEM